MINFLKRLSKKFHIHDWECVGRYTNGWPPTSITFQMCCRICKKWKNDVEKI